MFLSSLTFKVSYWLYLRFAYGVDGVIMRFGAQPKGIPQGNVAQDYWNRKNVFGMNCQVNLSSIYKNGLPFFTFKTPLTIK